MAYNSLQEFVQVLERDGGDLSDPILGASAGKAG